MTYKRTFYQIDTNGSTFFSFLVNSGFMLLVQYAMDETKSNITISRKIFFSRKKGMIFRKHQISTTKYRLAFSVIKIQDNDN